MKLKYKDRVFLFFLSLTLFTGCSWQGIGALEKNMEELFLWKITRYQEILPAAIFNPPQFLTPVRNWKTEDFEIEARAAICAESEKILFKKNKSRRMPIASLTKLMTASVVLENYDLSHLLEISEEAVLQDEERGQLQVGEILSVENLLYIMLIESSNDAAYALSEIIGEESFVKLMNHKARDIGLENTYFGNAAGLDPENPADLINYSTAEDLVKLTEYLLENQPLVWKILSFEEFDLYRPDGKFHHKLENTNEFLKEDVPLIDKRETKIIGGKTGWTPQANGCFLLVLQPTSSNYLIYVILSSNDKFEEMRELIDWTDRAFKW